MEWKEVAALVGKAAPMLGTLLTGPAGAAVAVGGMIASALGTDNTPEAVNAALMQNPDALIKLKQIEADKEVRLAELVADQAKASLADVSSARQQTVSLAQTKSPIAWGAPAVSTLIVLGYFFCIYRLFIVPQDLPTNAFQLLNVMFGALSIAFGQVCNYWLGSSEGSRRHGDIVGKLAADAQATKR
jgi:hypothetical protein